jgi:predicted mannosyl-3-phosphoglycerate phosphatase (HAD superfamily)
MEMSPSNYDNNGVYVGDTQTEAQSKAGDLENEPSKLSNAFGAHHNYDWSEVAYLFEKGEIPEELAAITDPIEYNYLLVRLRKEFNEKHKSNYLRYMNLQLPYHSRRDEVGGAITD